MSLMKSNNTVSGAAAVGVRAKDRAMDAAAQALPAESARAPPRFRPGQRPLRASCRVFRALRNGPRHGSKKR